MAELTLNRKLNLVIPVETQPGVTIYVHSTPIGREVFETYYRSIARTFTELFSSGLARTGVRVAKMMLQDVSREMGLWDGPKGVNAGLVGEIHRLTNVVHPNGAGWATTPFEDALRNRMFDEDDVSEIENALVFFTLASAMVKKTELGQILDGALSLWGARTELLDCTELRSSLLISTPPDASGERAIPSSIPH